MIPIITLTPFQLAYMAIVAILIVAYFISQLYSNDSIEWFSQHIIPENPREDRNISEDVMVYDYDNDCNLIAYYRYGVEFDNWYFMGGERPKNFKWRYFDIEIDQP